MKVSPMKAAIAIVSGAIGVIGFTLSLFTAPKGLRTLSIVGLSVVLLGVALSVGIPELRRRRRASRALPSERDLETIGIEYSVEPATKDDIEWVAKLEASVYQGHHAIPEMMLKEWYSANPNGFLIVRGPDGQRIGHLDILPIKPKTLEQFLLGGLLEREIRGDSLYGVEERELVRNLYVESIILRPPRPLQSRDAVVSVLTNFSSIVDRLALIQNVENLYAIAATAAGEKLMRRLGFELHSPGNHRKDGAPLFKGELRTVAGKVLALCGPRMLPEDALKAFTEGF